MNKFLILTVFLIFSCSQLPTLVLNKVEKSDLVKSAHLLILIDQPKNNQSTINNGLKKEFSTQFYTYNSENRNRVNRLKAFKSKIILIPIDEGKNKIDILLQVNGELIKNGETIADTRAFLKDSVFVHGIKEHISYLNIKSKMVNGHLSLNLFKDVLTQDYNDEVLKIMYSDRKVSLNKLHLYLSEMKNKNNTNFYE